MAYRNNKPREEAREEPKEEQRESRKPDFTESAFTGSGYVQVSCWYTDNGPQISVSRSFKGQDGKYQRTNRLFQQDLLFLARVIESVWQRLNNEANQR